MLHCTFVFVKNFQHCCHFGAGHKLLVHWKFFPSVLWSYWNTHDLSLVMMFGSVILLQSFKNYLHILAQWCTQEFCWNGGGVFNKFS
jgi:RsiW-degrading membrane proteinase PrsW (M82 family)